MYVWQRTNAGPLAALTALVGLLAGCSDATSSGQASAVDPGDLTSTSVTSPTGIDAAATQTPSGAAIIGEIPDGALQPGRYALPPVGPGKEPLAVVDVPDGYTSWYSFIEADKPVEPGDPLMLGLWVFTGVYLNPCAESHQVSARSVRATADAFLQQRFTSKTRPREVDVAGHHGLYMEVTTPTDLDYAACDDAELNLWEARPDTSYWTKLPGMVNRLWILDVEGQPMVIQMAVPPSAKGPQIHAMTRLVESATFETS
jgi:hypothetical protein